MQLKYNPGPPNGKYTFGLFALLHIKVKQSLNLNFSFYQYGKNSPRGFSPQDKTTWLGEFKIGLKCCFDGQSVCMQYLIVEIETMGSSQQRGFLEII